MVIREQMPKLGALQRWIRECDAVLTPNMSQKDESRVWQVLDSILRTTQPEMIAKNQEGGVLNEGSRLRWYEPLTVNPPPGREGSSINSDTIAEKAAFVLKPLQTTPGPERRPPNKHPALIFYSPPNTFPLLPASERTRQPHDTSFLACLVLSSSTTCSSHPSVNPSSRQLRKLGCSLMNLSQVRRRNWLPFLLTILSGWRTRSSLVPFTTALSTSYRRQFTEAQSRGSMHASDCIATDLERCIDLTYVPTLYSR